MNISISSVSELNLLETEEEKEEDAILQEAYRRGVISAWEFTKADIELIKLKLALDDALKEGIINQPFVDRVLENPGTKEEIVKLINELKGKQITEGVKKQVNKSVYLSGIVLKKAHLGILHALLDTSEIWTQKRLSKELGFSRQYIHRLTKRLTGYGFISVTKIGRTREYSITRMGVIEYVNSKHPGVKDLPQVRIHDTELQGEFLTERLRVNHVRDWRVFKPRGWTGYRKRYHLNDVGFVTVVLRYEPGTCTLHIEVVTAPTLDGALKKLNTLIVWIMEKLEGESIYVYNLHEKKSRSYAIVRDPLADISQDYNLTYNGEGFVIDHSHDVPEIEFPTIEGLKKYYAFIEKIMNGEFDLDVLTEIVRNYEEEKTLKYHQRKMESKPK